jgi:hypothetical protein
MTTTYMSNKCSIWASLPGMAGQTRDEVTAPDGAACYRVDDAGTRVLLVPATCRHGHDLHTAGYRVREANGLLRVRCSACASAGIPNPFWTLRTGGQIANVAELDDTPYR